MINVVCVWWGTKFPFAYVQNLKSMIERNTSHDFKFHVFSTEPIEGYSTKILKPGYEGWWNKLQMFDPIHSLGQRAIYFDLDTLVVNNLDWLFEYKGNMLGIEDVGSVNAHQPHLKDVFQAAVMSWNPLMMAHIWKNFDPTNMSVYRGDGEYLHSYLNPLQRDLIQHQFPGKLKSYKYQIYPDMLDDKVSIVCFHGRPSITQAMSESITGPLRTYHPQKWIKDYWR